MPAILLADTPDALLARLADDLAAVRDPWARHWLVLPGRGRGEWVQRRWAERSGIASRSQILSVRALVELAAAGGGATRPFARDDLALRIAAALPRHARHLPVAAVEAGAAIDGRRLAWSRRLADAIDMDLLCREPEERFARCRGLAALVEDPLVAPSLAHHLGRLDAATFAARCAAWLADWEGRGGAPRLWLQLDVGLPTILMRRLVQLLEALGGERARVYALSPSLAWWGDLRAGRRRHVPDGDDDAGPVLGPFGRRAQDLHVQLVDAFLAEGTGEEQLAAAAPPDHLLGRLQASCRAAGEPPSTAPLVADDGSFSVHACRSPLRELEVCRDRILQHMAADPTLEPDQVLLLLADPASYLPLVHAALQGCDDPARRLPVRLAPGAGTAPALVADGLRAVVAALGGRCDQDQLLALLEHPLIAARFGLDRERADGATCLGWLQDARFRWGLDRDQRQATQAAGEDRWHLAFALRRLALGAIVDPAVRDGVVDGAAPLDRAAGLAAGELAHLALLGEALRAARAEWLEAPPAPVARWVERCRELVETFLAPGDGVQAQQRDRLLGHLLPELLAGAPLEATLTADGFLRLLAPLLDELAGGIGGGGSGVRVAALADHAGTPARMVLVCGLGAERFPQRERRPAWHPLAGSRRRGDPDRREDDRHHLLLALLAAEDALVCCYEGGSTADDKPRPPSTPLADLLAAAERCRGRDAATIHHRHPLHGHSPVAHAAATPRDGRSHAAWELRGARALLEPARAADAGLWSDLLPPEAGPRTVPRRELRALLREPCRLLLDRLGLRLGEEERTPEHGDRFAHDGLEAWLARRALLHARLSAVGDATVRQRLACAGDLPPGRYGSRAWDAVADETPRWDLAQDPLTAMPEPGDLALDGPDGGWVLAAAPGLAWYVDRDGGCHCFSPSRRAPAGRRRAPPLAEDLPLVLDLLLQVASLGDGVISTLQVHFAQGGTLALGAPPAARARELLARLLVLRDLGRRLPLPWWRETHDAMRRAQGDAAVGDDPAALLAAGVAAWREAAVGVAPSRLEATRLCFRALADPFAWDGPEGSVLADPPHAEQPLALRCYAAYAGWQRDALGACRAEDPA